VGPDVYQLRRSLALFLLLALGALPVVAQDASRPFGPLRAQAQLQQAWFRLRLERILPRLLREHEVDCWVVPMREYNEDPVFRAIVAPTTFAARRRTIYVFCDRGTEGVERLALGGTSQGGLYAVKRSMRAVGEVGAPGVQAELWGDEQWELLREVLEERIPGRIAINSSQTFAFADGLTAAESEAMRARLGPLLGSRLVSVEALPIDLLSARLPEEEAVYRRMQQLVWDLTQRMFSAEVITPGVTRTSDLVWWWRQQVNDLGLTTWFQPSISIQRRGSTAGDLGDDPVIVAGDLLHCDVGIVALGLHTDTQHNAYVLRPGETAAPAGLVAALGRANRLQDLLFEEMAPGRTGNEILAATRRRMSAEGLDGTVYTHPIGLHGHGAGPLIGRWDGQEGIPGRGDYPVRPGTWYSSELQVTSPVPEWGGQPVRMAQEEDFSFGSDGRARWFFQRQSHLFLVSR
jgi:Xaa-Pro aminopeptidase